MALAGKDTPAFAAFTVIHSRRRRRNLRERRSISLGGKQGLVWSGALTSKNKNIDKGCVNFAPFSPAGRQEARKGRQKI